MEIDHLLLSPASYYTSDMPVPLTVWLCVKMYTSVEHDFCPTCYERSPVLRDHFCWAEGAVAQDRFYCNCFFTLGLLSNYSFDFLSVHDTCVQPHFLCCYPRSCVHLRVHVSHPYNTVANSMYLFQYKCIILALKVILLDRLQGNICSVIQEP